MRRIALVLLASCWTGPDARPATSAPAPPPALPAFEISLERGPCFGDCPVYRLTIRGDGRVDWLGEEHVAAPGARSRQIAPADVQALENELAAARFFERDRSGRIPHGPTCVTSGSTRTCTFVSQTICGDTSPTILTVRRNGQVHQVQNDHCDDEDPVLAELERRILEHARATGWIER